MFNFLAYAPAPVLPEHDQDSPTPLAEPLSLRPLLCDSVIKVLRRKATPYRILCPYVRPFDITVIPLGAPRSTG